MISLNHARQIAKNANHCQLITVDFSARHCYVMRPLCPLWPVPYATHCSPKTGQALVSIFVATRHCCPNRALALEFVNRVLLKFSEEFIDSIYYDIKLCFFAGYDATLASPLCLIYCLELYHVSLCQIDISMSTVCHKPL